MSNSSRLPVKSHNWDLRNMTRCMLPGDALALMEDWYEN